MKLFLIRSGLRLVRHPKLQLALISNPFWHHFGLILANFRNFLVHFRFKITSGALPGRVCALASLLSTFMGPLWYPRPILHPFWLHSGTILVDVCFNFKSIFATFWSFGTVFLLLHLYGSFLTPRASHFGTIFGHKNNKKSIKKCVHFGIEFWKHFSSVFN